MIANDQSVPLHLRIKAASEAAERQYPRLSANVTNRSVRVSYQDRQRYAEEEEAGVARKRQQLGLRVIENFDGPMTEA